MFYAEDLGYWVVSRYDDCRRALREFATFSASNALAPVTIPCPAARAALADGGFRSIPTITNVDPPAHTRTRRIAQAAFTPRRVAQMEQVVRGLVRDYLDRHRLVRSFRHRRRADVGAAGARPVPHPRRAGVGHHRGQGRRQDPAAASCSAGPATRSRCRSPVAWPGSGATAKSSPTIGGPGHATTSRPTSCTRPTRPVSRSSQQEVATILFGLLLAGHETTTNLLGNGLRRFLEQRDRWEALCAEPALIPNAVEEVLRYDSSVIHWRRRTTTEVVLSGVTVPADANVLIAIGAANRDPAVFDDPDAFDIRRRNARDHLSFGFGPHVCLGAPLARLEARVVFEELTGRQPGLRLADDQRFEFMPIIAFRGPTSLWVEA